MPTTRRRTSSLHGGGGRGRRPFVVAALCAALVAAIPAPAQAQKITIPDAVGDMVREDWDDDGHVPTPDRRLNDVKRTKLVHGVNRVKIRVDFVDLRRKAGGCGFWECNLQEIDVHMVTNERDYRGFDDRVWRQVQVVASPGGWSGAADMFNDSSDDYYMRCPVRHSIDYHSNVIKASFPRRCASNPRWMKFDVLIAVTRRQKYFYDHALLDRPLTPRARSAYNFSGRVYHGKAVS